MDTFFFNIIIYIFYYYFFLPCPTTEQKNNKKIAKKALKFIQKHHICSIFRKNLSYCLKIAITHMCVLHARTVLTHIHTCIRVYRAYAHTYMYTCIREAGIRVYVRLVYLYLLSTTKINTLPRIISLHTYKYVLSSPAEK